LFHVVGIFFLLMTATLWFAVMGEVKILNEFVDKLLHLKVAGYGFETMDYEKRPLALALAGSVPGLYLTVGLFTIGWMEGSRRVLKFFFALTGSLLALLFSGAWYKFLSDDHIMASSEKMELLTLSMALGLGSLAFCWLGFRKSSARPKQAVEPSMGLAPSTDMPSVEALLSEKDTADSSAEDDKPSSGDDESDEVTPPGQLEDVSESDGNEDSPPEADAEDPAPEAADEEEAKDSATEGPEDPFAAPEDSPEADDEDPAPEAADEEEAKDSATEGPEDPFAVPEDPPEEGTEDPAPEAVVEEVTDNPAEKATSGPPPLPVENTGEASEDPPPLPLHENQDSDLPEEVPSSEEEDSLENLITDSFNEPPPSPKPDEGDEDETDEKEAA